MSPLCEFLVEMEIDTGDLDTRTVDRLRQEEALRALELAREGSLVSVWRIPGRWANVGVWRARDENELRATLDSLPLADHISAKVQRLDPHPSDPRRQSFTDDAAAQLIPAETGATGTRRVARRFELVELPALSAVRRRRPAAPPPVDQTVHPRPAAATATVGWIDVNVTEGDDGAALFSRVRGAAITAFLGDPLMTSRLATGGAVERPDRDGYTWGRRADSGAPFLYLTHSGALGVDGMSPAVHDALVSVDLGRVSRTPAVATLPEGGEAVLVRSCARVTMTVADSAGAGWPEIARALAEVGARLLDAGNGIR